jgi:hypothetical protein
MKTIESEEPKAPNHKEEGSSGFFMVERLLGVDERAYACP